ncbi:hypothetical protein, partial [Vibrio barjaei]|uniref:hypothetical protein n=1 Tax=Vibrio barjaei TaxID=1676683 RepID=UPI0019CFB6AE
GGLLIRMSQVRVPQGEPHYKGCILRCSLFCCLEFVFSFLVCKKDRIEVYSLFEVFFHAG